MAGAGKPHRVLLAYWGRRGALSRFAIEAGRAARADPSITPTISVSRHNELYEGFKEFGPTLFPISTFKNNSGAVQNFWRVPFIRRALHQRILQDRIEAVIELMPHVWSPFIMPVVGKAGARYCVVVHDADRHPGDRTSIVNAHLDRTLPIADVVLTLSSAVSGRLRATDRVSPDKLFTLFHPDLGVGAVGLRQPPEPGQPLRLMFLGRILPYKGLPLFLDTVDLLREQGIPVEVGVFGDGRLGHSAERLKQLRAEVINRWLSDDDIASILPRYHALILSHVEASQSGVAAMAFGAGMPVVSTPVGGLIEQVIDGTTGLLATSADAPALAAAVRRLLLDPQFYCATCNNLRASQADRSMARWIEDCVSHAVYARRA